MKKYFVEIIKKETHTRLYLTAINILKILESNIFSFEKESSFYINRFVKFLKLYPIDLMVGIMKDMKNNYPVIYKLALEDQEFVDAYFEAYSAIRG